MYAHAPSALCACGIPCARTRTSASQGTSPIPAFSGAPSPAADHHVTRHHNLFGDGGTMLFGRLFLSELVWATRGLVSLQ